MSDGYLGGYGGYTQLTDSYNAQVYAQMSGQLGYTPNMYGNNIYIGNGTTTTTEKNYPYPSANYDGIGCKEPDVSEFKKLTNHRFHDLLDRFQMICMPVEVSGK